MSIDQSSDADRARLRIELDRHGREYRTEFQEWVDRLHAEAPIAWNDTHGGYWFVNGNKELFDVARRSDALSNDADIFDQRRGYDGIGIPAASKESRGGMIGGFLEMDPPVQRYYRNALNAYLSPAAVARWQPVLDEITRAALDEVIETGRIDFVDDLANIVPAVFTMALLGLPLEDWVIYCEPAHAGVYTPIHSPDYPRVRELGIAMGMRMFQSIQELKADRKPGLLDAVIHADLGDHQQDDMEIVGVAMLLIGGGFDTTTALTAHALEWLSENPGERERLIREWDTLRDSATEEFLRFYTPAQGDGRTVSQEVDIHGVHRCIGSNVARAAFKTMLKAVLDRLPDFVCDPSGAVHYETTQVINGMQHLPATFTPGERVGPGLAATIARLQTIVDEQRLAEPITVRKGRAQLSP